MFCSQIISPEVPILSPTDTVGKVLSQMEHSRLSQLPVCDHERFMGSVSEDELLDESEGTLISSLHERFMLHAVKVADHFLLAARLMHQLDMDIVPVLNENNEYEGAITRRHLFHELARKTGSEEYGSIVVLEMSNQDYSVGELNRLVESNDAIITQLNTWSDPATHLISVIIRINKTEVSDIVATFQRHEFTVLYYLGEELYRNELQNNLENLMNYLNL